MLLSIVIPTYNRLDLLRETIASVRAQTCGDYELIVVDDASEDGTWPYLSGLDGVRAHRNEVRLGLAANWNRAISLARGEYVYVLQDDDLADPGLVAAIAGERGPELICFATCLIDGDGGNPQLYWRAQRQLLEPPAALLRFAAEWRISSTQVVFRRSVFERDGGMDETFPIGSDAEMILRWMLSSTTLVIPDALARRRHWSGSVSTAVEQTPVMNETMRRLVASLRSRAREVLLDAELRVLDRGLHASFVAPYVRA